MDDRLRKVEQGLSNLHSDFRVMSNTLSSIDKTLASFKKISDDLVALKMEVIKIGNTASDAQNKANLLFTKYDALTDKITNLNENDSLQNVKIGGAERFVWLLVTIVVGFIVAKLKVL